MKARLGDLISADYLRQNRLLHAAPEGFGGSGWKHADAIVAHANSLGIRTMLDYGAGECTLQRQLKQRGFRVKLTNYDPGVVKLSSLPKPADFVVCTDVLEHVEPDRLSTVLVHLDALMVKGGYFAIATRPANKILPNGNNAHAIIKDTPWWMERLKAGNLGWKVLKYEDIRKGGVPEGKPHEVRVWLTK